MKRKLFLSSGLALVSLSAALIGCGGGGGTDPDPTPSPSPTPASERKIVFASSASGTLVDQEIYLMAADGSGRTRLTTNARQDDEPSLSPDGTKIVFTQKDETLHPNVYVMNVDGTNLHKIVDLSTNLFDPRWSRDGKKIAFWDFGRKIYVANADGSGATPVPNATSGDSPDFSPDGARIVYSHSTERDLYVINIDGTGKTKLASTPDSKEFRPRWSPNGTKIVCFAETTVGAAQILVMNADGSGSTPVRSEKNIQNADWSPSGAKILFENWNSNEIFTMNADGGGAVNLTNNVAEDTNPSW